MPAPLPLEKLHDLVRRLPPVTVEFGPNRVSKSVMVERDRLFQEVVTIVRQHEQLLAVLAEKAGINVGDDQQLVEGVRQLTIEGTLLEDLGDGHVKVTVTTAPPPAAGPAMMRGVGTPYHEVVAPFGTRYLDEGTGLLYTNVSSPSPGHEWAVV